MIHRKVKERVVYHENSKGRNTRYAEYGRGTFERTASFSDIEKYEKATDRKRYQDDI